MEPIKNDYELNQYIDILVQDAFDGYDLEANDLNDVAHELADGSEHVIYYYKAHAICQNCNTLYGEEFLIDCGFDVGNMANPYDEIATIISYGEIYTRLYHAIDKALNAKEAS